MPRTTFHYSNDDVTVVWKPETCIHSRICWTGLLEVFNPSKRPWVNIGGADTERIIEQVRKCPSGALSYFINKDAAGDAREGMDPVAEEASILQVTIQPDGPILINSNCQIKHSDGTEENKTGTIALCRCGGSSTKPYCDGTHNKIGFKG
jgi:uncharacterized Fe-S cluster protein YjdI